MLESLEVVKATVLKNSKLLQAIMTTLNSDVCMEDVSGVPDLPITTDEDLQGLNQKLGSIKRVRKQLVCITGKMLLNKNTPVSQLSIFVRLIILFCFASRVSLASMINILN
jgi:hypothetical protein